MTSAKTVTVRTTAELVSALNLPPQTAPELELRYQLQSKIATAVRSSNLTHAEVAKAAGTSRPRLTALLNGNTQHVSTDLMLRILAALGYSAKLTFRRHAA